MEHLSNDRMQERGREHLQRESTSSTVSDRFVRGFSRYPLIPRRPAIPYFSGFHSPA